MATAFILYSCQLDKFYIAQTTDLNNRLSQHNDPDNLYSTKDGSHGKYF